MLSSMHCICTGEREPHDRLTRCCFEYRVMIREPAGMKMAYIGDGVVETGLRRSVDCGLIYI